MKDKCLQFFTGKLSKSIYISIAAAVVCGAVVITSTVIVHNNNQKIDSVLESLSASESVSESVAESGTESVSDADNTDSGAQAKAPNGEPAGDKALQYLAEYDKLTAEYQAKRTELEKQIHIVAQQDVPLLSQKPKKRIYEKKPTDSEEIVLTRQKKLDEDYEHQLQLWEEESKSIAQESERAEREHISEQAKVDEAQRKLDALDAQYEKDVAALKAKYGIA